MPEEELRFLPFEKQILYIWIDYIRYSMKEIYQNTKNIVYENILNNIMFPMIQAWKKNDYNKIRYLCREAEDLIKFVSGNHYHIWLFIRLAELIQRFNLK